MRGAITQEDNMGCGAACVAFATGKTYAETVSELGELKAKTVGYQIKELADALSQSGVQYIGRHVNRVSEKSIYCEGTIVFLRRSNRYPYGHYLIRYQGMWMDPWVNLLSDKDIKNAKSGYRM